MTTHVHATSAEIRVAQRRQLVGLITKLRTAHAPSLVVLCGDMNEEAEGLQADLCAPPLAMTRLSESTPEGTCIDSDGTTKELDHIFAVADGESGRRLSEYEAHAPVRTSLSDHSLLWVSGIQSEHRGRRGEKFTLHGTHTQSMGPFVEENKT